MRICRLIVLSFFFSSCFAFSKHNLYISGGTGIGDTSWSMLRSQSRYNGNIDQTTDMTNPVAAKDQGEDFSVGLGYNFTENFAVEADYLHFATTKISFSEEEYVAWYRKNILKIYKNLPESGKFSSSTNAGRVVLKLSAGMSRTKLRPYLDAGPGYVYRSDILAKAGRLGASFGGGFEYPVSKNLGITTDFTYITGYGKSVYDPGDKYIPFVYAVNANLVYSF